MNEARSNDTPIANALPVLDRLDATHEQMRYWLGELQTLVNHMEDRGWDTWARDHARSVIDFFSHTARQHHLDVDRQIFPLITGRGDASLETSVDRLRQDQGWLEENWREVLAQLQPDFAPATWQAFQRLLAGDEPKAVAAALGLSLNAVFVAKSRILKRLRDAASDLTD